MSYDDKAKRLIELKRKRLTLLDKREKILEKYKSLDLAIKKIEEEIRRLS